VGGYKELYKELYKERRTSSRVTAVVGGAGQEGGLPRGGEVEGRWRGGGRREKKKEEKGEKRRGEGSEISSIIQFSKLKKSISGTPQQL
jgi:hypothetical protein